MNLSLRRELLLLILLPLPPAAVSYSISHYTSTASAAVPPPGHIAVADARLRAAELLWIDARPAAQFEAGHIPGAVNLPLDAWDTHFPQLLAVWSPERALVVYCDSTTCDLSEQVADRLRRELGVDTVQVLHGGWQAWQEESP